VRYDGETFVEGLPTSAIRSYSHKLSGHGHMAMDQIGHQGR